MRNRNMYLELGQYAHDLICSKARSLVGTAGFTLDDCDDIEQELAMDLLGRIPYFDPKKSTLKSFMARVIENRLITLIEERQAACRDWRLCQDSLDDPVWEMEEDCPLHRTNMPDLHAPSADAIALGVDLRKVLDSLPAHLRELFEQLRDSNILRVSQQTNIPRSTLYYRIGVLRKALRKAGL